jgi:hypothetical protein
MDLQRKVTPAESAAKNTEMWEFAEPPERQRLDVVMVPPETIPSLKAQCDRPQAMLAPPQDNIAERCSGNIADWLSVPAEDTAEGSQPPSTRERIVNFYLALTQIDRQRITDLEMQPARIQTGLMFVGFSALLLMWLLLHSQTIHPGLTSVQQIQRYWEPYITFVCMGVAGMMMLGREVMRPRVKLPVNQPESVTESGSTES